MKKIVALLLTLTCLIMPVIPFRSLGAESQNEHDYTYTITDGKATITGVQPSVSGDVVIPAVLGGYPVVAIGEKAFLNRQQITGITIPNGVATIGYEAFFACTGLISVHLPDSLTVIEDWAFSGCALTDVAIPSGVTRIGEAAFADCYSLNNIALPADVTDIGQWAFLNTAYYNNQNNWVDSTLYIGRCLVEANKHIRGDYTVKPGTTAIADYAFLDRAGLTGIAIPDSVVHIGVDAFYSCSLHDITVDENNAYYRAVDGVLFDKDMTTLLVYPSEKKDTAYTVPESVTVIADHAFHRSFVSEITLPNGLTDIGSRAFFNCYSLPQITIPSSVTTLGEQAFMLSGLKSVVIENGLTHIDKYAFGLLEDITIPPSVVDIHVEAFWGPDEDSLLIYGESGSYAQTFAQDNGIAFKNVNDPPQPLGDVNADDEVNAMDATRILLASVEKVTLLQRQSVVADVNDDGRVNTVDAARILLHTVGKKLIEA